MPRAGPGGRHLQRAHCRVQQEHARATITAADHGERRGGSRRRNVEALLGASDVAATRLPTEVEGEEHVGEARRPCVRRSTSVTMAWGELEEEVE